MLAHDLLSLVALDAFGPRIPTGNDSLRIQHQNRIIRHFRNQQTEPLFTFPQGLLSLLTLGNVRCHDQAGVFIPIDEGMRGNFNIDQSSVFLAMFRDAGGFRVRRRLPGAFEQCWYIFRWVNVLHRQGQKFFAEVAIVPDGRTIGV